MSSNFFLWILLGFIFISIILVIIQKIFKNDIILGGTKSISRRSTIFNYIKSLLGIKSNTENIEPVEFVEFVELGNLFINDDGNINDIKTYNDIFFIDIQNYKEGITYLVDLVCSNDKYNIYCFIEMYLFNNYFTDFNYFDGINKNYTDNINNIIHNIVIESLEAENNIQSDSIMMIIEENIKSLKSNINLQSEEELNAALEIENNKKENRYAEKLKEINIKALKSFINGLRIQIMNKNKDKYFKNIMERLLMTDILDRYSDHITQDDYKIETIEEVTNLDTATNLDTTKKLPIIYKKKKFYDYLTEISHKNNSIKRKNSQKINNYEYCYSIYYAIKSIIKLIQNIKNTKTKNIFYIAFKPDDLGMGYLNKKDFNNLNENIFNIINILINENKIINHTNKLIFEYIYTDYNLNKIEEVMDDAQNTHIPVYSYENDIRSKRFNFNKIKSIDDFILLYRIAQYLDLNINIIKNIHIQTEDTKMLEDIKPIIDNEINNDNLYIRVPENIEYEQSKSSTEVKYKPKINNKDVYLKDIKVYIKQLNVYDNEKSITNKSISLLNTFKDIKFLILKKQTLLNSEINTMKTIVNDIRKNTTENNYNTKYNDYIKKTNALMLY